MLTKQRSISALLSPKTVAVIGANEKEGYAGRFMRNLTRFSAGCEVLPVNPNYDTVFGLPCHKNVMAIGKPVDLAVVVVKAVFVEDVIRECVAADVKSALIISAGFRELNGEEGLASEKRIAALAHESGMRIVGPNCIGLANVKEGIWACSISSLEEAPLQAGGAALVSQSGATGFGPLFSAACDRNVGFKYIITTGNEADLGLCDFIDWLLDDDDISVVSVLIEGVKDNRALVAAAEKAKRLGKDIIALKIGESEVGARAAASHTASLTGDMMVFNAMARQYDILKVEDYDEMIEMTQICLQKKKLKGKRLVIASQSGGIGGLTGDMFGKRGFEVPVFGAETRDKIGTVLKGFGSPRNPLDLTGYMRQPVLKDILKAAEALEDIDGYVLATHGGEKAMANILDACAAVEKPAYIVWTGSIYDKGLDAVRSSGLPFSFSLDKCSKNLQAFTERKGYRPVETKSPDGGVPDPVHDGNGYLNESEAKKYLAAHGVTVPQQWTVRREEDLETVLAAIPPGKTVAMKILSSGILHKSDIGGVHLGLSAEEDLRTAYRDILSAGRATGKETDGVLVEEMCADGLELMVGIRADPLFGPTLLIGLGGVYTEIFRAVSCRLLPVSPEIVEDMIGDVPGLPTLFAGFRGKGPYDRRAFGGMVCRLCDIFWSNREKFALLEVNPVRILPGDGGVYALDCVMKCNPGE